MATDDGLDVPAVVERFNASAQTLEDLRERLKSLVLAEEGAGKAVTSIEDASREIVAAAGELQQVAVEIQEVRKTTVDALEAARTFLDGTDLGALREEVTNLGVENRKALDELRATVGGLSERIPEIETARAEADAARAEVEALKLKIPEKVRKKMGI